MISLKGKSDDGNFLGVKSNHIIDKNHMVQLNYNALLYSKLVHKGSFLPTSVLLSPGGGTTSGRWGNYFGPIRELLRAVGGTTLSR